MRQGHTGRRALAGLLLLGAVSAGCTGQGAQPRGDSSGQGAAPPTVAVPKDQRDLVGTWRDAHGRTVPDGSKGILVLGTSAGSTTCTVHNVTVFMELAWPPGRRLHWDNSVDPDAIRTYLRDATGSLMKTDGRSDLDTTLPAAARSTGLNRDGNVVYAVVDQPDAIWVRRASGQVERWARLAHGVGCA